MPFVTVGEENSGKIDLYYEDHGAGDPVVLIHGWPLSSASWEKQITPLLEAGHRVIAYDRRGFGKSSQPTTGYDYNTLAKDLDILITKLELTNVTLIGFSMGGGEVARYLGSYGTASVKKAAFISAIPPFLLKTPDNPTGVDQKVFDDIKKGIVDDRPAFLKKFFGMFFNKGILKGMDISEEAVHANWIVAAGASPKGTFDCVTSWATDFRQDLAAINIPTLIVHGDADKVVPIEASGIPMSKTIKDSKLVILEGAPHGLNWTHAEDLNRELLNFLA